MRVRHGKPLTHPHPLPAFAHCPMCNEIVHTDDLETEVVIDGKQVRICSACTYDLNLESRIDE